MREKVGEHRTTNYISKSNNLKSTLIFFAGFSLHKPSQAPEVLPFDPTVPMGINICNSCNGNSGTSTFRFLLKNIKPVLVSIYVNLSSCRNICSLWDFLPFIRLQYVSLISSIFLPPYCVT